MRKKILILLVPLFLMLTACDLLDEVQIYKVTFVDTDGTVLYEVTPEDGTVTLPEDPTKAGFVFDGWYADSEYQDAYDEFDLDDILGEDLTVYAKWTPAVFNVTFHFGVGYETVVNEYLYGDELNLDNPPIKQGYDVGGFFIDQSLETEFDPTFAPLHDFDVYVKWVPKTVTINYFASSVFEMEFMSTGPFSNHLVTTTGQVFAWGSNELYTIGEYEVGKMDYEEPVDITHLFDLVPGERIIQISETDTVLALSSEGRVYGWGLNHSGELGSSDIDVTEVRELTGLLNLEDDKVVSVSSGFSHSVLLTQNGNLIVAGEGGEGQLGNGANQTIRAFIDVTHMVPLNEGETIIEAHAFGYNTLLITSDYRILSAGSNTFGQVGMEDVIYRNTFTDITMNFNFSEGEKYQSVALGEDHVLVLSNLGNVYTYGRNGYGQLGKGDFEHSNLPVKLEHHTSINKVIAFGQTSYFIDDDGSLYIFGDTHGMSFGTGLSNMVTEPEIIIHNAFAPDGPLVDFIAGNRNTWIIDPYADGYIVFGQGYNENNLLLDSYSGVVLNDYIDSAYELIKTEEHTYGEVVNLFFPEADFYKELTKWYTETEKEHRFYDGGRLAYEELNLYGDWETRFFMATFYENNGNQGYIEPYTYEQAIHKVPRRLGYTFVGWYTDENLTEPFVDMEMPGHDITLYAKWEVMTPEPITVPFDGTVTSTQGVELYSFTLEQDQHVLIYGEFFMPILVTVYDENMEPIQLRYADYVRYGMDTEGVPLLSLLLPAGEYHISVENQYIATFSYDLKITLSDYFVPERHTITLDSNGGNLVDYDVFWGGEILDPLPIPYKAGFTFTGWYVDEELTTLFDEVLMPNEDIVLYAGWEEYVVPTLTLEQGEYQGVIQQGVENMYVFTLTETLEVTMYTISEMDTYGTLYDESMNRIIGNDDYNSLDFRITITLEPGTYYLGVRGLSEYEQGPYTLIFGANEVYVPGVYTVTLNTMGGPTFDPLEFQSGIFMELPLPVMDGYIFETWYLDEELTIRLEDWMMPDHDITLYAKYIVANPIDATAFPFTEIVTLDPDSFHGYEFTLTTEETLELRFDSDGERLGVLLDKGEIEMSVLEVAHASITGDDAVITVTLEPGTYYIVIINIGDEPAKEITTTITVQE